jgi:hypothetical protein
MTDGNGSIDAVPTADAPALVRAATAAARTQDAIAEPLLTSIIQREARVGFGSARASVALTHLPAARSIPAADRESRRVIFTATRSCGGLKHKPTVARGWDLGRSTA